MILASTEAGLKSKKGCTNKPLVVGLVMSYIGHYEHTPTTPARRIHVVLSAPADAWINAEAQRLGFTRSEILRRIVDKVREEQEQAERRAREHAA
jgi:hypothetical protein